MWRRSTTGSSRRVLKGTSMAAFAPTGHLFFFQGSTLVAQRFDTNLTRRWRSRCRLAKASAVRSSALVAWPSLYRTTASWHTRAFPLRPCRPTLGGSNGPGSCSSGSARFPLRGLQASRCRPTAGTSPCKVPPVRPGRPDIWTFDLVRRQATQVTFADGADRAPVWSPDGKRLVFASLRPEGPGMYVKAIDRDAPEELVMSSDVRDWEEHWPLDWSARGHFVRARQKPRGHRSLDVPDRWRSQSLSPRGRARHAERGTDFARGQVAGLFAARWFFAGDIRPESPHAEGRQTCASRLEGLARNGAPMARNCSTWPMTAT